MEDDMATQVDPRLHALRVAVDEVAAAVVAPGDLAATLHRLTEHTSGVVDACGAGILLEDREGELRFAAASEERIIDIEQHQEHIESGACWAAYTEDRIVAVGDLEDDSRWPEYRTRALDKGLRAVLGVPMRTLGRTVGVINIYRDVATSWSENDVSLGQTLAALAATCLTQAHLGAHHQELTENLQRAIDSRDIIGQAKGVLMSRDGLDADAAFEVLRERSQRENRKLRELARAIVDELAAT
jgi:GAF domain-containing protein